jgi:hypothetical protein
MVGLMDPDDGWRRIPDWLWEKLEPLPERPPHPSGVTTGGCPTATRRTRSCSC